MRPSPLGKHWVPGAQSKSTHCEWSHFWNRVLPLHWNAPSEQPPPPPYAAGGGAEEVRMEPETNDDEEDIVFHTPKVRENSFDPDFGGEPFRIVARSPATTLVVFSVVSESRVQAYAGCPIVDLRAGFRSLALVDRAERALPAEGNVLVHVKRLV